MIEHPLGHTVAVASIAGSLLGWLPHLAAFVGIIYYSLLIYKEIRLLLRAR